MTPTVPTAARRIGDAIRRAGDERSRYRWPAAEYHGQQERFGREVLGIRKYWHAQREWFRAYNAHARAFVCISTGQKTGKTEAYITIVACDFASESEVQWFLFAPKLEHTNAVFWPRFVKTMLAAYKPCAQCLPRHDAWLRLADEDPFDKTDRPPPCRACTPLIDPSWIHETKSEEGLVAPDGRRVQAYAALKKGALGGFSGRVRFGTDESSDVSDDVRESIQGNTTGGGKFFAIGNPLYASGWFARAFRDQRGLYTYTAQVSSRTTPNCAGRIEWSDGVVTDNKTADKPIPNLANVAGISANLIAWQGAPAIIAARIDGKAPEVIPGQLAAIGIVLAAERRWKEGLAGEGPLQIGVDVAKGTSRDSLAVAVRRGRRIIELLKTKPGSHAAGAAFVVDIARQYRREGERPRIVFDASGNEGKEFGREIRRYAGELELYPIIATFPPRDKRSYDKLRDEIAHYFADWLKLGAIPPDAELEAEIDVTKARQVEVTFYGKTWSVARVITNDEVEKILRRHPDKRNACELAVWPVEGSDASVEYEEAAPAQEASREHSAVGRGSRVLIDPYAGGTIDPYGGTR